MQSCTQQLEITTMFTSLSEVNSFYLIEPFSSTVIEIVSCILLQDVFENYKRDLSEEYKTGYLFLLLIIFYWSMFISLNDIIKKNIHIIIY